MIGYSEVGNKTFIPLFGNGFYFLPSTSQFVDFVLDILVLQNEPLKKMSFGTGIFLNELFYLWGKKLEGKLKSTTKKRGLDVLKFIKE